MIPMGGEIEKEKGRKHGITIQRGSPSPRHKGSIGGRGTGPCGAAPGVRSRLPGVLPRPQYACSFTNCLRWETPSPWE